MNLIHPTERVTCSCMQRNHNTVSRCSLPFGSCQINWSTSPWSLHGVGWPPACHRNAPSPLDFIGCFGKCQLLAPKGWIWRSSLMKEKDEVCIHVPFQWEMLEFGDMNIYRKRKAGGVVLFCFPWWLNWVINVPWSEYTQQVLILYCLLSEYSRCVHFAKESSFLIIIQVLIFSIALCCQAIITLQFFSE